MSKITCKKLITDVLKEKIPSESQEQKALVQWLRLHPTLKGFFFKNDNEGKRTPIQGRNAKLLGLKPGVSDLFIFYPTKTFHGLFIEMKRNKKYTGSERSSDSWMAQERFISTVRGVGFDGHFCYGWEHAKSVIEKYLNT